MGQTTYGEISGLVTDETGGIVVEAEVQLLSVNQGTISTTKTNSAGLYIFASVQPGPYQIKVHHPGFKQVDLMSLIVNVQDHIQENVRLQVGSVSESVTVTYGDKINIDTTDASVSTVVDQTFVKNMPLNGRSFQDLILLTPGTSGSAKQRLDGSLGRIDGHNCLTYNVRTSRRSSYGRSAFQKGQNQTHKSPSYGPSRETDSHWRGDERS